MAKYNDIQLIGSGGFGEVYTCERESDGRKFAKKKLNVLTQDAIDRFRREVRLVSSLDHPNVIHIVAKRLNEEPYFFVMPLYANSLDALIPELASDKKRVEDVFSRILDGVAHAHEQGVVHRDLKPANILLNHDADLVISDFGLGRQLASESTRRTRTGDQMGTELYMAPEQFSDAKRADECADVFALGRILVELYAGFLSPGNQDLTCIPARYLPIVRRATHHDAYLRFSSAVEMRTAWQQAVGAGARGNQRQSLETLIAKLSAEPTAAGIMIEELVVMLVACSEEPDEVHSAIMNLPPSIVGEACNTSPDDMITVVTVFAQYIEGQNFAFSYTDTLANHCVEIIEKAQNAEIRARLAAAIANVGSDHNRWYVMERAAKVIESVRPDEEAAFILSFADVPERTRDRIAEYVTLSRMPPKLRSLFNSDRR